MGGYPSGRETGPRLTHVPPPPHRLFLLVIPVCVLVGVFVHYCNKPAAAKPADVGKTSTATVV